MFDPIPAEDEQIAHAVIGAAIEVHRFLGPVSWKVYIVKPYGTNWD